MQPTNDLDGMLAFNANWTEGDRDRLSRMAQAAGVTDWTYQQNGNRPGYQGGNSEGQPLLWVMAGRVRVTALHASTTVPRLIEAGIEVLPYTREPWASHEVLLSNAGGAGTGGSGRVTKAGSIANAAAAEAAVPVLRAAAVANRSMSSGEFAQAVGILPRHVDAVLRLFMTSGEDPRWAAFVVDPTTGEPSHGYSGTTPTEARAAAHRLAALLYGDD